MRSMKKVVLPFLTLVVIVASCYKDNAEDMYQNFPQNCDVTAVSFAADIQPTINTNCVGCHGATAPSAGLSLTNYNQIFAAKDKIKGRVTLPESSPLRMPPGGMAKCNVDKIVAWIDQGALNN